MPSSPADPPSSRWAPPIPPPLQRLFDRFPLAVYPANDLPQRSPSSSAAGLPILHVFISEDDAVLGRPSFNPSCLKWQAFLRIAGVKVCVVPSNNHASPSGALPFLQPPIPPPVPSNSAEPSPPRPVAANKLYKYAVKHSTAGIPATATGPLKQEAYQALLDGPIRTAWLHALYLSPPNAGLLTSLYARPASSSPLVQATLLAQLRRAAAAEIVAHEPSSIYGIARLLRLFQGPEAAAQTVPRDQVTQIYAEAREALAALEALLLRQQQQYQQPPQAAVEKNIGEKQDERDEGHAGEPGFWFFGGTPIAAAPTGEAGAGEGRQTGEKTQPALFDAAVFAYTHLLLGAPGHREATTITAATTAEEGEEGRPKGEERIRAGLAWVDRTLPDMVAAFPTLVRHHDRMLAKLWPELCTTTNATATETAQSVP